MFGSLTTTRYVVDGRHLVSVALATGRREIEAWIA
jgi:hypothetical protein